MIKIIIEGPPGSGKSKIMDRISKMLAAENKKHICVEEIKDNDYLVGGSENLDFIIMTKQRK